MKDRLTDELIAMRAIQELNDGEIVNLGVGIPTLLSSYVPKGKTIIFHSENGIIGFGRARTADERDDLDYNYVNATGQYVTSLPGMSIVDMGTALGMARGGHVDVAVLGALQVSQEGDLANWVAGGVELLKYEGRIGGAMDIAAGARRIIVTMRHNDKDGSPKILKKCTYLLTRKKCVHLVISDLAVMEVTKRGLVLREVAPGWTPEEVQAHTDAELIIAEDVKEMTF